jgi:hypothetical protein
MNENMTAKEKREWKEWEAYCKRLEVVTVPTVKETELQKKQRIQKLLKPENFEAFISYYFANEDFKPAPLAWFHREAIDNVFVKKLRKHAWEFHRESAKSVVGDIFIPISMLVKGDLTGMILASETGEKAKNLIKDVEAQLRSNQKLISDFGRFGVSGSWTSSFFQTNKGVGFWSFGLGQNPAGVRSGFKRPNLGIVDDADNKDAAKNQELTLEKINWIKGEFMGCLAKDNRTFIYLNNRVHPKGITAHLVGDFEEGMPKDESYAHIKAYLTEDPITHEPIFPEGVTEREILQSFIDNGAQPAWKEYYTLEDCAAKVADYGVRVATRQMYHTHIEDGDLFTDENMPFIEPFLLNEYDALVTYCDPAFGESGKGSFKGIVLVGKKAHYYDILWVWLRQKGNWIKAHRNITETFTMIDQLGCEPEKIEVVQTKLKNYVEANSLQCTELNKSYKLENLNYDKPWFPLYDDDKKPDKIERVETLEPIANHGLMRFNKNFKGAKDMNALREQFKQFPKGKIDGPDAVKSAIDKLDLLTKKSASTWKMGSFFKKSNRV